MASKASKTSKTIKGLTVEIGGDTTKLGQALESVNKKSRDLSSELGQINKLLKMDPGNTELLSQKQKVLSDAVENTADKLKLLKEAEKQVQKQFERGEVSEEQVRALQREIIATTQKLDNYEKAAKGTTEQIKKAGKASKETGEQASKMGAKMKAAGDIAVKSLTAVASIAAAAAAALTKASADAAAYADNVLTLSTVTGISTEKLQAYAYAAELVDVSVDTLTKSQAKQIKSMKAAQDGTKQAVEAYEKLGISVTNADGSLRDSETVYWEVIDALGKMENETERDAIAMQILGKSAQELNPLIEAGADRMAELTQEAQRVGAVLSDEALNALGAFDDSIQRLNGSAGAAKNALGTVLLPELTALTTESAALLSEFTNNLNASGGGLDGFIATVDKMSEDVGEKAGDLIGNVLAGASDLIPAIIRTGISLVVSLAESIVAELPGLVSSVTRVLIDSTPVLLAGATSLLLAAVDAVDLILPPLTEAISQIIVTLVTGLVSAAPELISGAVQLLNAIILAIPLLCRQLLPQVPVIVDSIISGLLGALPLLVDGAVQLLMGILSAFPEIQQAMIANAPSIVKSICDGLLSAVPELVKAGGQLLSGLVKGMLDFDIVGSVKDIGDSVVKGFKKAFDINSPSRRAKNEIGKPVAIGLAEGIEENADAPMDAMLNLSDDMIDGAEALNGLTLERRLSHTFAGATPAPAEGLSEKLDRILEAIKNGHILVIDGDKLVGATYERMDAKLGQKQIMAERGAV